MKQLPSLIRERPIDSLISALAVRRVELKQKSRIFRHFSSRCCAYALVRNSISERRIDKAIVLPAEDYYGRMLKSGANCRKLILSAEMSNKNDAEFPLRLSSGI